MPTQPSDPAVTVLPAPFTPSRREQLGGRWAISWQATVLGGALMVAIVTLAGTSIGASPVQPHELGSWFLSALVGLAAICAYTALAHLTVFRKRRARPVAIPIVVLYHLGLGMVFAVALSATAYGLGLVSRPVSPTTTFGFAVGALVWCLTVSILLDSRERFQEQTDALFDDVVQQETQRLEEASVLTSISSLLAQAGRRPSDPPRLPEPDFDLVSLDDWWRVSAAMQKEQATTPEELPQLLEAAARGQLPPPTLGDVVRDGLIRQPFSIPAVMAVVALAYAPDGTSRLGAWGILATLGLAASVGVVLAGANLVVRRRPAGLGFGIGLAAAEILALLYLHGYDLVWLLTTIGMAIPVDSTAGAAPAVDVPVTESVASVIFMAAVLVVTSGQRSFAVLRSTYVQDLQRKAQEQAQTEQAALSALIDLTEQARAITPEDKRAPLTAAVDLLTEASAEPEALHRRELLSNAAELLNEPVTDHSLRDHLEQTAAPWRIMSDITVDIDPRVHDIAERLHDPVVRVVDEAMTNACRHGLAEQITVDLRLTDGSRSLSITVKDDGSGLADSGAPGMGTTLFEEVSQGNFALVPNRDRPGASLTIEIPLE